MLNRFQFARLRGFRRGKKRAAEAEAARKAKERSEEAALDRPAVQERGASSSDAGGGGSLTAPSETSARSRGGVPGGLPGEDRIEGLLRRHQEQRGLAAPESLLRSGSPATGPSQSRPAADPPVVESPKGPVEEAVVEAVETSTATERRAEARTRTVEAIRPAGSGPKGVAAREQERDPARERDPAQGTAIAEQRVRLVEGLEATTTARVVCIASGKGGTGKSVIASNLALLRARQGERVLLIDFDAGLANAHLLLGLAPPHDVGHVMEGTVSAREALVEGPHGLKLLAGGVGRQSLIDPTRRELDRLFKALRPLEDDFDLIVIDHGAGLSYSTVAHLAAASTLVLVTNHEVTALSDGYALYKRAKLVNPEIRVGLVVNRAPDERLAMDAWNRFRGASHKFLGHAPELIGWVPADPVISQAVQLRKPAVLSFPESPASKAICKVAAWGPMDHARTTTPFYVKARRALR